jgi:hypothetical protein
MMNHRDKGKSFSCKQTFRHYSWQTFVVPLNRVSDSITSADEERDQPIEY